MCSGRLKDGLTCIATNIKLLEKLKKSTQKNLKCVK